MTPQFEGFRIVAEVGAGAMSTVYKAVQEPLGRLVALKVLKSTISPTSPFAAQLEREARVLAELSHSNIGVLHDFVKSETEMYLVLEYVDGFSLAEVIGKGKKLPPEVAAAIGAEVARGLAHAHERGIVHRDIKPANVMLSARGDVKIADFGIAQFDRPNTEGAERVRLPSADEPITKMGEAGSFGTPAYMSPEQILGEVVDARSDIFSLGVVLYQLLSGSRPFEKEGERDRKAAAQRIRRDPPVPLHRRAPEVPRALERVVMRAVEKLPVDRYSSARVVAEQLDDFVLSRTRTPRAALCARALVHAGLITGDSGSGQSGILSLQPRGPIKKTVIGLAVLGAIAIAGGTVIQWAGRSGGYRVQAGARPLELKPAAAGYLRVLATPWAEVSIDGQMIDVTPFARAISLQPGTHYVTLAHPDAPPEKRTIEVVSGETLTLDIALSVRGGGDEGGMGLTLATDAGADSGTLDGAAAPKKK